MDVRWTLKQSCVPYRNANIKHIFWTSQKFSENNRTMKLRAMNFSYPFLLLKHDSKKKLQNLTNVIHVRWPNKKILCSRKWPFKWVFIFEANLLVFKHMNSLSMNLYVDNFIFEKIITFGYSYHLRLFFFQIWNRDISTDLRGARRTR